MFNDCSNCKDDVVKKDVRERNFICMRKILEGAQERNAKGVS